MASRLRIPMPEVEHQRLGPLNHQIYADMFGWEDIARVTVRAYYSPRAEIRSNGNATCWLNLGKITPAKARQY